MEFAAVAFKLDASFHLSQNGWFGFTTDFNEIICFHECCLGVGEGKCSGRAAPVHYGAARWPVTALQLTDSLCWDAMRSIMALSCMQTAPLFI